MKLPELPEITALKDTDILIAEAPDGTKKIKKSNAIPFDKKDLGATNGIATLDANGKVPSTQLPSFVDDVIEGYFNTEDSLFYEDATFTKKIEGESGKIYVDLTSEKTYRYSGTIFVEISESIALGETENTAYRGDRGKEAYDTSQTNKDNIGVLSNLTTEDKTNLVNSINEVDAKVPVVDVDSLPSGANIKDVIYRHTGTNTVTHNIQLLHPLGGENNFDIDDAAIQALGFTRPGGYIGQVVTWTAPTNKNYNIKTITLNISSTDTFVNRGYSDGTADVSYFESRTSTINVAVIETIAFTNFYIGDSVNKNLKQIQNELTFDTAPSSDSTNPVTSNGIYTALNKKIDKTSIGVSGGVAELDENGHVLSSQLPSYVDDVLDGYYDEEVDKFYEDEDKTKPYDGESGKIYVDLITNKTYRYTGSGYAVISDTIALGETAQTAYRGDRGKQAYDDSQLNKEHIGDINSLTTTAKTDLVSAVNELDETKQDNLTFDSAPTEGSTNPVTSNGIYKAIGVYKKYTGTLAAGSKTLQFSDADLDKSKVEIISAYMSDPTINPYDIYISSRSGGGSTITVFVYPVGKNVDMMVMAKLKDE